MCVGSGSCARGVHLKNLRGCCLKGIIVYSAGRGGQKVWTDTEAEGGDAAVDVKRV